MALRFIEQIGEGDRYSKIFFASLDQQYIVRLYIEDKLQASESVLCDDYQEAQDHANTLVLGELSNG